MPADSTKKTLVITGAFGSLGQAAAQLAQQRGYRLALLDYASAGDRRDTEETLVLGNVDLADEQAAAAAMAAVVARFGRLDALLNIAGGFVWQTFADHDTSAWERMFSINLKTAVNASRAALPQMLRQQRGAIVCVSAVGASKAELGLGPYAASKAGVARFVEALAREVKDQDVRVNAVAPSIIDTPPNRADMPDADFSSWVTPTALAEVMLFLASDAARAVTGAVVPVTHRT